MNILTEQLPDSVIVDGKKYPVNSDFRSCLKIILAFEDIELTGYEKQAILLHNLFIKQPENTEAAFEAANIFLNGGSEPSGEEVETPFRLYSFSKDANFIFAAFRQTHGIDLQTANLHWYEFLALFMDLGSETTFSNLIGLRKRVKNGTASKEEKKIARDMNEVFEIPEIDDRTPEEKQKEIEFMRLVKGK